MTKQEVSDARGEDRFIVQIRLEALFGTTDVVLIDLGEHGVQMQHDTRVKLGSRGRLQLVIPGSSQQIRVSGQVVWSRISTKPDTSGRHSYLTGLRVDDEEGSLKDAIEQMLDAGTVQRDIQSLEKKKKALLEKDRSRKQPGVKIVGRNAPRLPGDVILLIRQTRQRLQANPTEAVKWYNRAKYSLDEAGVQIHHRDEILAIWEYLERSIELNIIARVVDETEKQDY